MAGALAFLKRRKILATLAILLVVLGAWALWPRQNHFHDFDPAVVGRDEANLWRAYYERRYADLANGLVLTESRDFGLSPADSARSGLAAAEAARLFQRSHSRAEAQAALPKLTEHFAILASAARLQIDPAEAARLELEWWQLRRENVGPARYAPAVAAATAYLYGEQPETLSEYARLRVAAMDLRDRTRGRTSEADWAEITRLLVAAYGELDARVSRPVTLDTARERGHSPS